MKNKRKIAILISGLCLLIILISAGVLFNKYYLSKVIISGPLSVSIEGIPAGKQTALKIYGNSPTGKMQVFRKADDFIIWEYFDYSSFKSLFLFLPDSSWILKKIVITTKNNRIVVTDLKNKISNNTIDLGEFIKGKVSKSEIIFSIFHWKEFNDLLLLLFAITSIVIGYITTKYLITIWFHFSMQLRIRYPAKLLFSIFLIGFVLHILFFVFSKKYLISSGVILTIFVSLIVYLIFKFLRKTIWPKLKMKEISLSILTIAICLCVLESLFILTGYKSTYNETRCRFFYSSVYVPEEKNWFHIWSSDHNLKTSEYCYHRKINSEGLSDKEFNVIKDTNEYRIIGLGDSFTEGDGAHSDSTWLKFLQRNLSKYATLNQINYFNGGVCGSDPLFSYVLLKNKLLKYKPDLVLLSINSTDLQDIFIRGDMDRFQADSSVRFRNPPWWEPIYAMSHISRLLFSAMGYNELLYKESETDFKKEKQIIIENINDYCKLADGNNFKLVVIFHPGKGEIESGQMDLSDIHDDLKRSNKVEVFDMLNYFIKEEKISSINCGQYYWKNDGHHNAKGYELFARGVEWKLKEMGIIDSLMKK